MAQLAQPSLEAGTDPESVISTRLVQMRGGRIMFGRAGTQAHSTS